MTWTTLERWVAAHPDTLVLTTNTGFLRDYSRDPYGTYNPKAGYYATQGNLYDPLRDPGRTPPKLVVFATRTPSGSFAASKPRLREDRVVEGVAGGVPVVAVYDPALDTAYVYRRDDDATVATADENGTYRVADARDVPDGTVARAAALPLDELVAFDVMWFAWNALYSSSDAYV